MRNAILIFIFAFVFGIFLAIGIPVLGQLSEIRILDDTEFSRKVATSTFETLFQYEQAKREDESLKEITSRLDTIIRLLRE